MDLQDTIKGRESEKAKQKMYVQYVVFVILYVNLWCNYMSKFCNKKLKLLFAMSAYYGLNTWFGEYNNKKKGLICFIDRVLF